MKIRKNALLTDVPKSAKLFTEIIKSDKKFVKKKCIKNGEKLLRNEAERGCNIFVIKLLF